MRLNGICRVKINLISGGSVSDFSEAVDESRVRVHRLLRPVQPQPVALKVRGDADGRFRMHLTKKFLLMQLIFRPYRLLVEP